MGPEALDAFRQVVQGDPAARYVFAGEDADGGTTRRHAAALGLADRVHFLGRLSTDDYGDLVGTVDVGLALRRPPTFGETSAALLDLLAAGVAVIVTDVATFGDFPDPAVRKVRWDADGPGALAQELQNLVGDAAARQTLGHAARNHVRRHHEWQCVAQRYFELIERCHAAPRGVRSADASCG
jgi:glycosyltransferase involved in cell wall biosynthesis